MNDIVNGIERPTSVFSALATINVADDDHTITDHEHYHSTSNCIRSDDGVVTNEHMALAHALRGSITHDEGGDSTEQNLVKWHSTLCRVLAEVSVLTEQHNRDVVTLFLTFMDTEYDKVFVGTAKTQDLTGM